MIVDLGFTLGIIGAGLSNVQLFSHRAVGRGKACQRPSQYLAPRGWPPGRPTPAMDRVEGALPLLAEQAVQMPWRSGAWEPAAEASTLPRQTQQPRQCSAQPRPEMRWGLLLWCHVQYSICRLPESRSCAPDRLPFVAAKSPAASGRPPDNLALWLLLNSYQTWLSQTLANLVLGHLPWNKAPELGQFPRTMYADLQKWRNPSLLRSASRSVLQ